MGGQQRDERVGRARLGVRESARSAGANLIPSWPAVKCAASARRDDSVGAAAPSAASRSPATHGTRSSSLFHSAPSTPPAVSTRAISGTARDRSNQCSDCAQRTASTDPSASGIASAGPARARADGTRLRSSASIASSGSTAVTSAPRSASSAVSLPVPAPRSSTRSPLRSRPSGATHHCTASGG